MTGQQVDRMWAIELAMGERATLCPDCEGHGAVVVDRTGKGTAFAVHTCPRCHGEKQVSWYTDAVTGDRVEVPITATVTALVDGRGT